LRHRGRGDRRVVRVSITPKGKALLARIQADLVATQRALLAPLARAEREAVLRTLAGLVAAVPRWQDGGGPLGSRPAPRPPRASRREGQSR
ncbi:MAG: hypothetical protein ACREJI_08120, partial [Candidatus Methylomirabilales bacterium]